MRKIIVLSRITLDGVLQAPSGPDEDASSSFKYGGWTLPYNDEISSKVFQRMMEPSDLLLGRKTYDVFVNYWPHNENKWPGINDVTKYVFSKTIKKSDWQNTVFLRSIADIKKLKKSKGSDLKIWGSSQLIQLLLENDLVDELWFGIYPLTVGNGKKLFANGAIPATFTLTESVVTSSGVIFVNYKRVGKLKAGSIRT